MPKRGRKDVPTKKCIFCPTDRNLTKEHIFAEWIRQEIPRDPRAPKTALHMTGLAGIGPNMHGKLARPGEMGDKKLRVVCGPCNNNWMSGLQTLAKPILVPLIRGNWSQPLDSEARTVLATWVTMLTMVLEYADPPTVCLPQSARTALRLTQQPLDGWAVFLGRNTGIPIKFYHQAFGIPADIMLSADATTKLNTHITTFTVGPVLIQAMSSQVDYFGRIGLQRHTYCKQMGFEQIWPIESDVAAMPTRVYDDLNFVVSCQYLERTGFFGDSRSTLREAIDRGMVNPSYTGYSA